MDVYRGQNDDYTYDTRTRYCWYSQGTHDSQDAATKLNVYFSSNSQNPSKIKYADTILFQVIERKQRGRCHVVSSYSIYVKKEVLHDMKVAFYTFIVSQILILYIEVCSSSIGNPVTHKL